MGFEFRKKIKIPKPIDSIRDVFARLLQDARTEIVERTLSGRSIEGAPFVQYTPKYAAWKTGYRTSGKQRRKRGRVVRPKFGSGGTPNLALTGRMLESISTKIVKVTESELVGRITIAPIERGKAIGNQTGIRGNGRKFHARPFFGISKKQKKELTQKILEALRNG